MEERVNFTLVPSLTRSILAKIAITLWHKDDIRDIVSDFNLPLSKPAFYERLELWQLDVEGEVMQRVLKLQLPEILRKQLSCFVGGVGWQIMIWKDYHENNLRACSFRENWNKICWTSQGTIDMKKTAEILVKSGNLSIENRYKLACTYCLEDDIYALWKDLSNKQFHGKDLKMIKIHESPLVSFWSHLVEGKATELNSMLQMPYRNNLTPNEYAFQHSARIGNVAAVRYFLQKLTPEGKQVLLVETAKSVAFYRCVYSHETMKFPEKCYADVLCFLLSAMHKEEQIELFEACSQSTLKCLLDWPWQDCFMETANCIWTFLCEEVYYNLLIIMIDTVIAGYKDYNYQKLFEEFWKRGPDDYKRYVIGTRCALDGILLTEFFQSESKEMISLILKDANHVEKEKILRFHGTEICRKLIYDDEWDLLKFFIGECVSSQEILIKWKVLFKDRVTWRCSTEQFPVWKHEQRKFFELLDYFIRGFNKRESAKEDLPAKKFRNVGSDGQKHKL